MKTPAWGSLETTKKGLRKGYTRRPFIVRTDLVAKMDYVAMRRKILGTQPWQKYAMLEEALELVLQKYAADLDGFPESEEDEAVGSP